MIVKAMHSCWKWIRNSLAELWRIRTKISTLPHYESYNWGDRRSFLAKSVYFIFFWLRVCSMLQIRKFLHRFSPSITADGLRFVERGKLDSERCERLDFHARDTEFYMLFIFAFALVTYLLLKTSDAWMGFVPCEAAIRSLLQRCSWCLDLALAYLIVESLQWTFYYLLLRPLIERRMDIYDSAEYLIVIPLVFANQLLLFSSLLRKAPLAILRIMFNLGSTGPDPATEIHGQVHHAVHLLTIGGFNLNPYVYVLLSLLGITYQVVILASLIRVVPEIPVRKRPNITIIGFGDVVRFRILPALRSMYQPTQIAVAADRISKEDQVLLKRWGIACFSAIEPTDEKKKQTPTKELKPESYQKILGKIRDFVGKRSSFAIVAVPTQYHLEYARMLHDQHIRFAIEKPLVFSEAELRLIRESSTSDLFAENFVLSYYWLEKALPLNYFLTLNPRIAALIEDPPSPQQVSFLHQKLGALKSITLSFEEMEETEHRFWTELQETGGMVAETLIHPLTLVMQLAHHDHREGKELWKSEPEIRWFRNGERAAKFPGIGPTSLELMGELASGARVFIRCGKYFSRKRRCAIAVYENGSLTMDCDAQILRVFVADGSEPVMTIRPVSVVPSCKYTDEARKLLAALQPTPSKVQAPASAFSRLHYQIQMELVNSFFTNGWGGLRFDHYHNQLKVIHELLAIAQRMPTEKQSCDVDPHEHAAEASRNPLFDEMHLSSAPHGFAPPEEFQLGARAES